MNLSTIKIELKMGTPLKTLFVTSSQRGSRAPGRWWECSGLDHRSRRYTQYTNAPVMVFVLEGTVVATGAVLLDFSKKHHKFKKIPNKKSCKNILIL